MEKTPKEFVWAVDVEPNPLPAGPVAGKCTHNSKCLWFCQSKPSL